MIIQALVKRYEDTQEVPPGWQNREVSYALDLSRDGELLNIIPLETADGKKRIKLHKILPVEPSGRTSGIKGKGSFLCDNGGYFLAADNKRGAEKFEESKRLHLNVLKDTDTATARAIIAFFEAGAPSGWEQYLDRETAGNAKFIFLVDGVFADYDNQDLRLVWDKYYSGPKSEETEAIRCLITGKMDQPEATHGSIKLYGGQPSGSSLISANADSFTSYGKTKSDRAADVGKYAAFAYVTALNNLLKSSTNRQYIGGDTLVYWAEDGEGKEEEVFSWMAQPSENDAEKLDGIMEKAAKGVSIKLEHCKLSSRFYLLCLSPNAGRISVRFFYTDSFGTIITNIVSHHQRLEITKTGNDKYKYLPIWMILGETTVKKQATDASPLLGGQYLHSIITGSKYPMTLYQAMLNRVRAGEEINKTKAAVFKALLIQNFNISEVTTVALNPQTNNKPYVLGRLFSVLEQLQQRSSGSGLNATIRDKYFASACANPGSVFITLLKLSNHHAAKLDNAIFFEKLKTELLGKLDVENPFPAALNLEDQGRFILGYYHQTQDYFTPKKNKEEKDND